MRFAVTIDDALLKKARTYTCIANRSAHVGAALQSLIEREAMLGLAAMAVTMPDFTVGQRRRRNAGVRCK